MIPRAAASRAPLAALALAAAAAVVAGACSGAPSPVPSSPAPATAAPPTLAPATRGPGTGSVLPAAVSVTEAAALRDAGAFILDIRQPDEWAAVHIPGATLIPLGDLPGRLSEVPRDRDVVVVCRSGSRSRSGRDILLGAGFTRVTSMTGGVREWQAAGLPTESGS